MKKDITKQKAKILSSQHFTLYYRNRPAGDMKIGFQAGAYCGNAVARNRVKRYFRILIKRCPQKGDYFIRLKKNLVKLSDTEIEKEWNKILKKISL
ncbi:MAG TPA: ribonuclease P protein component [bacterium]|nr:ribonuclease P protein component [bacterium]